MVHLRSQYLPLATHYKVCAFYEELLRVRADPSPSPGPSPSPSPNPNPNPNPNPSPDPIPHKDSVYEYFVDPKKRAWAHWEERLSASFRVNTETMPFYRIFVPTTDTARPALPLALTLDHRHGSPKP